MIETYRSRIETSNRVDQLIKLRIMIENDKRLSKEKKTWLLSLIGRKLKNIDTPLNVYKIRVKHIIDNLPIDLKLEKALEHYFTIYLPQDHGIKLYHLNKYALNYIPKFILHLSKTTGDIVSLETLAELKPSDIQMFLRELSDKPNMWKLASSYLNSFGRFLVSEKLLNNFPRLKFVHEARPKYGSKISKRGVPRKLEELDRIFYASGMKRPKMSEERYIIYQLLLRFLLQTGLRPAHALLLPASQLKNVKHVRDALDREFVIIEVYEAIKNVKRVYGELITKKVPVAETEIDVDLYNKLSSFVFDKLGYSDSHFIFSNPEKFIKQGISEPLPSRTLQHFANAISRISGVENFSLYDMRHTWASVIYQCSGRSTSYVAMKGAWSSEHIPIDTYVRIHSAKEALKIADKYKIYLDKEIAEYVKAINL